MILSRVIKIVIITMIALPLITCCGQKKESHWGQELSIDKKWWKKEGQSWDRETNIFMTIGYSNPSWKDEYDMRKSADLDARAQVASFMNSLVKNYMEEVRSHNFTIAESVVEASADETVLGSVIVERKKKGKKYLSLVKVDLGYFFAQIYKKYRSDMEHKIRRKNRRLKASELDQLIEEKVDDSIAQLKELEEPVIEETLEENGE
jgi:hypothetical protein